MMPSPNDIRHLEELWSEGIEEAYQHYRHQTEHHLALAAALVEAGIGLHGLGRHIASPRELLLGDLCLARASRLLAERASHAAQVAFAASIERVAGAAASRRHAPSLRRLLTAAVAEAPT
jgi:hypothetical protein